MDFSRADLEADDITLLRRLRDVQHLLRHLNDPTGLRRNPLVRKLFARGNVADHELHARIRSIVMSAVDKLAGEQSADSRTDAARWQSIIRRCDLQGELHMNVAADLGLGKRQFYRVRRRMHEVLLNTLVREFEGLYQPAHYVASTAEVSLELARGLRDYGRTQDAVSLLLDLASSADEPGQRLSAIADLADAYNDLGEPAQIATLIESANRLCYGPSSTGHPLHEAEVHLAHAALAHAELNVKEIIAALQRAQLRSFASIQSARAYDVHLKATLDLAQIFVVLGDLASATQRCRDAHQLLAHRPGFARRRAELSQIRAKIASSCGAGHDALNEFGEALADARLANLPKLSGAAELGVASVHITVGNWQVARQHARNAAVFANAINNPIESAVTMVTLAWIELESGSARDAIAILQKSRQNYPHKTNVRYIEDSFMAAALARTGFSEEAVSLIESASDAMRSGGLTRHLGRTEIYRAQIYQRVGRWDDAKEVIAEAVRLLESAGTRSALAQAYATSAALTGTAKHQSLASELKAQLRI